MAAAAESARRWRPPCEDELGPNDGVDGSLVCAGGEGGVRVTG